MIPRDSSNPAYVLLPKDVQIPAMGSTEHLDDPLVVLKYFTPDSSFSWYVTEYDPDEQLFFGVVVGHEREFGYFSLDELESIRGPIGLPVERDLHFKPTPASQCK